MAANRGILGRTGGSHHGRLGFGVGSSASPPARWLDEVMAEDRRRLGIETERRLGIETDSDVTGSSPARSRPPLSRAAAGVIGGLCIILGAQVDAAFAGGSGRSGGGIVLRGDGRATEATVLGAEGLLPGSAIERTGWYNTGRLHSRLSYRSPA